MKKAYKDQRFGEFMIFSWHDDFKKGHLSAHLVLNPAQTENIVNDKTVNIV